MGRFTFIFFFLLGISLTAQNTRSSTLYLQSLHKEVVKLNIRGNALTQEFLRDKHSVKIPVLWQRVKEQIEASKQKLGGAVAFAGDTSLVDAYLVSLDSLHSLYVRNYATLISLRKFNSRTTKDLLKYHNLFALTQQKELSFQNLILDAEKAFSKRHGARNNGYDKDLKRKKLFTHAILEYHNVNMVMLKMHQTVFRLTNKLENYTYSSADSLYVLEQLDSLKEYSMVFHLNLKSNKLNQLEMAEDLMDALNSYYNNTNKLATQVLLPLANTTIQVAEYSKPAQNAKIDIRYFRLDYNLLFKKLQDNNKTWALTAYKEVFEKDYKVDESLLAALQ